MNHLKIAHLIWQGFLKPGMHVIDATMGNGHDTLALAKIVLSEGSGRVDAFDIQEKALKSTEDLLKESLSPSLLSQVHLHLKSHETFPKDLPRPNLIAYNLGYLPGGDKSITTLGEKSLQSCQNALSLLLPGGILSITMYPGHAQGSIETNLLLSYLASIPKNEAKAFRYSPLNSDNSPILILLEKQIHN
jgi:predicted methyltransferase